jgi:hypothetical protein
MTRNILPTFGLVGIALAASTARAQDHGSERNLLYSRYAIDGGVGVATDDAGLVDDTGPAGSMQATYTVSDLPTGGDQWTDMIRTDVLVGYQLDWFRAGVDLPLYPQFPTVSDNSSLGSAALDLRATIIDRKTSPLGVGVSARGWLGPSATLPTAEPNNDGGFEASVAVDDQYDNIRAAVNAGWREVDYDPAEGDLFGDSFFVRAALRDDVSDSVGVFGELEGELRHDLDQLTADDSFWAGQASLGLAVAVSDTLDLQARVGNGFRRDTAYEDDVVQPFGGLGIAWTGADRKGAWTPPTGTSVSDAAAD